jgi:hypothetical protein
MSSPHRPGAPSSNEVLGVPLLPPAAVTTGANRLRAALGRLHAAMAPPPLRILEGLFGVLDHRVLVALCQAGVPEALDRPQAPTTLADRLGVEPAMLERLLRYAAARGWLRIDRRGRVRPTRVTRFLRRDHPGGWRGWVDFAGGDEVVEAVTALTADTGAGHAFTSIHGAPFFEWMASHPHRWEAFDRAMAAGGRMHALGLAAAFDWPDGQVVCDVGGGTGALLATLVELRPALRGLLVDLPEVVERAASHPKVEVVAGDAFAQVPAGADSYLLVNVLHDWSDADAVRMLDRVAAAAGEQARVIVVEAEHTIRPRDDMAVRADVLMAVLTAGGRERTAAEFASLGARSGLELTRTVRLASGDVAHELRARTAPSN